MADDFDPIEEVPLQHWEVGYVAPDATAAVAAAAEALPSGEDEVAAPEFELPDETFLLAEPTGVVEWTLDPDVAPGWQVPRNDDAVTSGPADADADASEEDEEEDVLPRRLRVVRDDEVAEPESSGLRRAISGMALGTAASRATGLIRVLVLAWALGLTPVADAFNLANQIPNMVFDLVLGGVIGATFVPVLVTELERRRPKDAWRAISAVYTVALVGLAAATLLCVLAAPWIIDAFTGLHHTASIPPATLAAERHTATVLLRWFVPQIFLYGLLALTTSFLNVHRIFGAPAWVPIVNNAIAIAVLILFARAGRAPSLAALATHPSRLILLGAGTTGGVLAQAVVLLVALRRTEVRRLRWNLDVRDSAVRRTARLGSWTLGLVVTNQVALFIVLGLAFGLGGSGQVSAYSYAWIFFQAPYAIFTTAVLSGIGPSLARAHAREDDVAFTEHFGRAMRAIAVITIPMAVLLFVLARPAMQLLLGLHGAGGSEATTAGQALAAFALGLPGFSLFQISIRAFQSRHHGHVAFFSYCLENAATIALALAFVRPLGVAGLALANSIAYTAVGVIALGWLWLNLGGLATPGTRRAIVRASVASLAMGVVAIVAVNVSTTTTTTGLLARIGGATLAGAVAYWLVATLQRHYERPL